MRRIFLATIDLVKRRFAAADMVREILNIGKACRASWNVQARNLYTDPMAFLEEVGCG